MPDPDPDTLIRWAAFAQVRRRSETHDYLIAHNLKPGFKRTVAGKPAPAAYT